jgi:hypothetical protein
MVNQTPLFRFDFFYQNDEVIELCQLIVVVSILIDMTQASAFTSAVADVMQKSGDEREQGLVEVSFCFCFVF